MVKLPAIFRVQFLCKLNATKVLVFVAVGRCNPWKILRRRREFLAET